MREPDRELLGTHPTKLKMWKLCALLLEHSEFETSHVTYPDGMKEDEFRTLIEDYYYSFRKEI